MSIKRQTIWNLAPQLVTAAVAFFSMPLFVRYLGTELYAMFLYVTSVSQMFGFADLGLGVVVGRNLSISLGQNDQAAVRRYWGTGNLIVLPVLSLATLGFISLTVGLGPLWFDKLAPANVGLFRACLVANGLGLFFAYYGSYWLTISQAYLDFKFIGLIRSVMTPLQIIPSVMLASYTHNPLWVLVWSTLVSALQLLVLVWHARTHYSLGLCLGSARLACVREMAGYTAKMISGLVVGAVFGPVVPNLLGRLATATAIVPFGIANNIASRLQSLSVAVMGPVMHNTARVADQSRAAAAKIYDDMFAFMFEWYLLATLWLVLWHSVLLRLYLVHTMGYPLGQEMARATGPLLIPLMAACCFTALANVSSSQLTSMNRLGTTVLFSIAGGLLATAAVWIGWHRAGMLGGAYGYLLSRIACVAQDLYAIRLIKAGGWLAAGTWRKMAGQGLVTFLFGTVFLFFRNDSTWLLIPAAIHGCLVAAWLLRAPLRRHLAGTGWIIGSPVL
jgi:O-antigen/teichoic acid export membrane protein